MIGDLNTTFGHRPIYICGEAATFTPHSSLLIQVELSSTIKGGGTPHGLTEDQGNAGPFLV